MVVKVGELWNSVRDDYYYTSVIDEYYDVAVRRRHTSLTDTSVSVRCVEAKRFYRKYNNIIWNVIRLLFVMILCLFIGSTVYFAVKHVDECHK